MKKALWTPKATAWGKHIVEICGDFPESAKTIPDGEPGKTVRIIESINSAIIEGYSIGDIRCAYIDELSNIP